MWIDSRMRTSGTDSDFEVSLRESVHLSDARVRVDKLTFTDSFLTTDAGRHLYFRAEVAALRPFLSRRALIRASGSPAAFGLPRAAP